MVDAALAGLGGCPFAPGAAGNVATEDAAWLLSDLGYELGVDHAAIVEAARWLGDSLASHLEAARSKRSGSSGSIRLAPFWYA